MGLAEKGEGVGNRPNGTGCRGAHRIQRGG